jgi:diguanylate cyclase (GGDEF)-like protein/PAS domain S-box-containing protein
MELEQIKESSGTHKRLLSKIRELQLQLREAEKVLKAIKAGEFDALVISGPEGERIYTLTDADRPYRSLVEEMNEGAMTLGPDGTLLYCNRRFAEMLQLPLDKVLGEPFAQFVAPEDQSRLEPLLAQALQGNAKEELTLLAADASRIFVQLSLRTLTVEGTLNLSAVAMDITARKEAEDALRASEERFAQVFEASPLAITLSSLEDGHILEANASFSRMVGYAREEIIGLTTFESDLWVDPTARTRLVELLREEHSVYGVELSFQTRSGEVRDGLLSIELIDVSGETCILSLIEDITERKRAEQKLRESEEHFRLLLSGVKDYAIFMLDPAGQVASWNENAKHVEGYGAEEILGNHFAIFYPPEEVARGKPEQHLRTAITLGRAEYEDWQVRRNGTRFWANVILSPLYDDANNLRGFVQVTRDVTRQKQAQEEIRAHAARAEALVRVAARLNAELEFDTVLATVCEETTRALNVPIATLALYDPEREAYVLTADVGLPPGYRDRAEPMPRAAVEAQFSQLAPVAVIPDLQAAANLPQAALHAEFNLRTMSIAALWHKGELMGTLSTITVADVREFSLDELALLQGIADQAAEATANARLHEQVQKYADELERRVAERTSELETANQKLQTEIAEHAQAEEALRASEERFRVALADSRITVYNQDRNLRYTWIHNPVPGLQVQDLLGKTDEQVFSAGEAARLKEIKLQALEKGSQAYGEISLANSGDTRYFDLTVEPQLDQAGNIIGITCIAVDITERKIAQSALQQANQNLLNWAGELEQRNREISQMNEMGDLLQSCLTIEEAYRVIEQSGRILFPGDSGALYVLNESRNLVELAASWGDPLSDLAEHVFAPDNCWALRRGRIHVVANSSFGLLCSHVNRAASARTPFSYLCAPMVAQGEALGVFYLQSGVRQPDSPGYREGTLTESKERLAVSVAEHVALALSSLRLRETLHNQAIRDPLTGLFNRRYMEESLERELRRSIRKKSTVGIIMLDLDHFKRFNDTFGHDLGDTILSAFGDFLQRHIRSEDLACRYGGEEFTLILPEATLQETYERAEQVRRQIKFVDVQHNGRSFGNLSISCGVAVFPEHGSSAETILRAADAALYRAKAEGRDRVVVTG